MLLFIWRKEVNCSSIKKPNNQIMRLYYSAFLYTEYILRNTISTNKYFLTAVREIKETIKNINDRYSPQLILDSIIELECYYKSNHYNCKLFCGAIFKKYTNRKEYKLSTVFDEVVMYVYEEIKKIPEDYLYLQEITKYSLQEGVYISHIDTFQSENYYLDMHEKLSKEDCIRHIFFKDDNSFWGNIQHIAYEETDYSGAEFDKPILESREDIILYYKERQKRNHFCFYIDINDKNFNLKETLIQIQAIIIGAKIEKIEDIFDEALNYKYFIDLFFKKGIHRINESEIQGKIIGLLLWDERQLMPSNIEAMDSFCKKYHYKVKKDCTQQIYCTRECLETGCNAILENYFRATNSSIENKKISATHK